jgi:hypothetical protein
MKKFPVFVLALCMFIPSALAFAKGEFDYITIKGPGITGEINVTNPALTADFFAFADFSKGSIEEPLNPGEGYQIVRVYVVDNQASAFDQLHYYPYTGYVYYDGLVGGWSEYDGKWYAADVDANEPFRAALSQRARLSWATFGVLIVLVVVFVMAYYKKPKA